MNRQIKLFSFLLVMFVSLFFTDLDGVKAEGYAKCIYDGKEVSSIKGGNTSRTFYRFYQVEIVVNNSGSSFSGEAIVGCTDETLENERAYSDYKSGVCYVHNADVALTNNDSVLKSTFFSNGKWSCPDNIYITFADKNKSLGLNFSPKDGATKFSLQEDKSKSSGSGETSNDDVGGAIRADHANSANVEHRKDAKKPECDSECIKQIKAWSGKGTLEFSTDEINCTKISQSLKDFLNLFFWIIAIIGVILLIIMTIVEFIKVITLSEEDGLKGAFKHTVIRVACIVILLLLPTLVPFVINVINENADYTVTYTEEDGNEVTKPIKYTIGEDGNPVCSIGE